jgi:hypothetical protein
MQRLKMLLLKTREKSLPTELGLKEERMLTQDGMIKGKQTLLLSSNTKSCFSLNSAVTAKF